MKNILITCVKDMPPVKDETIREANCLDIINISEKSPAKNSALVDVRACNKPAAKVRNLCKLYISNSRNSWKYNFVNCNCSHMLFFVISHSGIGATVSVYLWQFFWPLLCFHQSRLVERDLNSCVLNVWIRMYHVFQTLWFIKVINK